MKHFLRVLGLMAVLGFALRAAQELPQATRVVNAARAQVGVTTQYDPAYTKLAYPNGDVPRHTGVCSDVVVRALRGVGLDLQQAVHDDMAAHFAEYPKKWGLKKPDRNIDHRRVPNLMRYFERNHVALPDRLDAASTFLAGDIVTWDLGGGITHIGIVSDRKLKDVPLILHNIGAGAQEENVLFAYRVTGHYRLRVPASAANAN